jgi:two-component system, OmpR family, sensor histidine kinase BaeS
MNLSIKYKLFFAMLSVHLIVYTAMYSIGRFNFDKGFLDYISRIEEQQVPALVDSLTGFYKITGSWDPIRYERTILLDLIYESIEITVDPNFYTELGPQRNTPGRFSPNDWYYTSEYSPARPYIALLDADQSIIWGSQDAMPEANLNPIVVRGETVGFLAITSRQILSEQADLLFSDQQKDTFFLFALFLGVISALFAFPLSAYLVRPIHGLVQGTRQLARGDYTSRIPVKGSDELTQLSVDFNSLADTLDQNRQARQQWIADISHELRTPLSILQGELESLQDGIRPMTPETINSLHNEVVHLNALVNDLHELSMSDQGALIYKKEPIDLQSVFEKSRDRTQSLLDKQNIKLTIGFKSRSGDDGIQIIGDESRLLQLFDNLFQNTCRYTDEGGELVINFRQNNGLVVIEWYDSKPGVTDDDLSHLFDRLYRVDVSRNRKKGGSGLGLAICKNIIEAHGGSVRAEHSSLGGLNIIIQISGIPD